jgi:enamine deaminase RidA (YjgF/YER057c/UK114 family)
MKILIVIGAGMLCVISTVSFLAQAIYFDAIHASGAHFDVTAVSLYMAVFSAVIALAAGMMRAQGFDTDSE